MRCRRHHEQLFAGRSVWLIVVLASTVLSFPATTWSQQVTASITGKVADPSSGIIAGAKVTAKDLDRGTLLTTETNAAGFYNLPRVPIGTYDIRVEVVGFQTALAAEFNLDECAFRRRLSRSRRNRSRFVWNSHLGGSRSWQ